MHEEFRLPNDGIANVVNAVGREPADDKYTQVSNYNLVSLNPSEF